jgi:hypothetical protein
MGSPVKRQSVATLPSGGRAPANTLPAAQRSAVTNGKLFAATIRDGRSGWSRRMQDLQSLYVSHMGGEDIVSEPERSMARRIATSQVELEWIESGFASSKNGPTPEQLDLYWRGSNSLRRHLESIGLKRALKDVTPTLSDYLHAIDDETDGASP